MLFMNSANLRKWAVEFGSDVFNGGTNEDGEMIEALRFFVCAHSPEGRNFFHVVTFPSYGMGMRDACERKAERLADRVNDAIRAGRWVGPVGNPNWVEGRPSYGSERYVSEGWEEMEAAREREEG
jgi:hypothetical protein